MLKYVFLVVSSVWLFSCTRPEDRNAVEARLQLHATGRHYSAPSDVVGVALDQKQRLVAWTPAGALYYDGLSQKQLSLAPTMSARLGSVHFSDSNGHTELWYSPERIWLRGANASPLAEYAIPGFLSVAWSVEGDAVVLSRAPDRLRVHLLAGAGISVADISLKYEGSQGTLAPVRTDAVVGASPRVAVVGWITDSLYLHCIDLATARTVGQTSVRIDMRNDNLFKPLTIIALDSTFIATIADTQSGEREAIVLQRDCAHSRTERLPDFFVPLFSSAKNRLIYAADYRSSRTVREYEWEWVANIKPQR